MQVLKILYSLQRKKIKIWVSDNAKIYLEIPDNIKKDDNVFEKIKKHKKEIIDFLVKNEGEKHNGIIIYNAPALKVYPLSFAQENFWFMSQYQGDFGYAYNEVLNIKLDMSVVNVTFLIKAINELIKRHSSFRTLFKKDVNGVPYQEILPFDESTKIDLFPEKINESEIKHYLTTEEQHVFDLSKHSIKFRLFEIVEKIFYILCVTVHHIIIDGVSIDIFNNELNYIYEKLVNGNEIDLPPIKIQYSDFVIWQREYFKEDGYDSHLSYWKNKLMGFENLNLPYDKLRSAVHTYAGSSFKFEINSNLKTSLFELLKKYNCSLFMILLSGLYILFRRYSNQNDIVIGSPISNRYNTQLEGVIGCFLNTLALRINVNNQTVEELLDTVRLICLEAYQHKDTQFEFLVKELNIKRDLNRTPIFQTMFILQNQNKILGSTLNNGWADYSYSYNVLRSKSSNFDLLISATEVSNIIDVCVEINEDLFQQETVKRMFQHYTNILAEMAKNPHMKIDLISCFGNDEYNKMIYDWNRTEIDYINDKTVCGLFENQVRKTPDNIAVIFKGKTFTYKELNAKINRLSRYLIEAWLKRKKIVVLLMDRGVDYLISMFAVWKSGGAFIPIDPKQIFKKNISILENLDYQYLLTSSKYEQLAYKLGVNKDKILVFNSYKIKSFSTENPAINIAPHSTPAYIMFTSGSTGTPKGAIIYHAGMLNHLLAKVNDFNISQEDVVAETAAQTFDVSIWQFVSALLVGGKTQIFDDEDAWEPIRLLTCIENNNITIYESVPSHMAIILDELERKNSNYNISSLRWFIMNGEGLPSSYCKRWLNIYPDIPMANVYGPTECSDDVTHYKFNKIDDCFGPYIPIGKPIQNIKLYVLDKYMNPLPIGVPGELYISGLGVGGGYINSKESTEENFIENPFTTTDDIKKNKNLTLYKTGDFVRYLPDGNLEYLNRADRQTKLNGVRLELSEIESKLLKKNSINQCVVTIYDNKKNNSKQLIAYYVCCNELDSSPEELKSYLIKELPIYMVPSFFIKLNKMPLNSNGKIEYKALPKPDIASVCYDDCFESHNPTQKILINIWGEILKLKNIGINNNFFELGGHSLLAIQAITKINVAFKKNYPVVIIFTYQTIIELAAFIDKGIANTLKDNFDLAINDANFTITTKKLYKDLKLNQIKNVLLTGVTGFLGIHLLENLLLITKAKIFCIIRGKNDDEANKKLKNTIDYFRKRYLYNYNDRIVLLNGDLEKENLNLSQNTIKYLENNIDSIFHNGALVHHLFDYKALRKANVLSTIELLKLATKGKKKQINYISTSSTSFNYADGKFVEHDIGDTPLYDNGYDMSKWVSEKILQKASAGGIPINIFRPGNITGDSLKGICSPEKNRALLFIKGCIQIKAAPNWNNLLEMTPVDIVSKAIVTLALKKYDGLMSFNLVNPNSIKWIDYINKLNDIGFDIKLIESKYWVSEYLGKIDTTNAIYPIKDFYKKEPLQKNCIYDYSNLPNLMRTQNALISANIIYPYNYAELIKKYMQYLQEIKFL
jgi:amino acid adenylation domain-containing protein/thioester reductase-like protein